MKKLLAAFALAVVSATALAGGGWNGHGYRGNGGYGSGYYNNGWAAFGGLAAGIVVGSALAAPYYNRGYYPGYYGGYTNYGYSTPIPYYPAPAVVYQSAPQQVIVQQPAPQVIVERPQRSELQGKLDELRALYDRKELSYAEYYRLRAETLNNYTMPR